VPPEPDTVTETILAGAFQFPGLLNVMEDALSIEDDINCLDLIDIVKKFP